MLYFAIIFFLLLLGSVKKRSKAFFCILYISLFILCVSFTEGHDLKIYETGYEQPFINTEDTLMYRSPLWAFLMVQSKLFGLSFYQFRILCFFLWSIPICFFIKKYANLPTWVLSLIFLFPILAFSSQIRNGVAIAIFYIALNVLFTYHNLIGKLLYIAILIFAGILHNGLFFYILGLLALSKRLQTKTIVIFEIVFVTVSLFFLESGLLSMLMSAVFGDYYATVYFSEYEGILYWKNIPFIVGILMNLYYTYRAKKFSQHGQKIMVSANMDFSEFVLRFNLIMLTAIPLLAISNLFYRLFQNVFILSVISVANIPNTKGNNIPIFRNIYFLFYMIGLTAVFTMIDGGYKDFWNSISIGF